MVMSRSFRVVLSFLLCLPVLAWGQQTAAPASSAQAANPAPKPADSAVPEGRIRLDVVVTDKAGKPVTDLESKDFKLLDNNSPLETVSFQAFGGTNAKPDQPTEVILLFDYVNDDFKTLTDERREVEGFLQENGGHLAQPVSIFLLRDAGLQALRPPSTDGNELAAAVGKMATSLAINTNATGANGDIEKYNESIHAISSVAAYEKKRPGRKLLLWIGPGWPLLNSPHFQVTTDTMKQFFKSIVELSTDLREARVNVYSVGIGQFHVQFAGGGGQPDSNKKPTSGGSATFVETSDDTNPLDYLSYLKEVKQFSQAKGADLSVKVLALHNGGRALGLDNGLKSQIDTCVQDATAFYTLSFDAPRAGQPNEYHDLKVQIDKPGLTAHTSTGYYNQP
jgi:VWFA-related protein